MDKDDLIKQLEQAISQLRSESSPLDEIIKKYELLDNDVRLLIETIHTSQKRYEILESALREWLTEMSDRIEWIERLLFLVLGKVSDNDNLIDSLETFHDKESTKRQIYYYNRRLNTLLEQQAITGLETSPDIVIQIEDIEEKIAQLKAEL